MTISVVIAQMDAALPPSSFVATGVMAQPGGQTMATPLTARWNIVTNCVPSAGVALQIFPGNIQTVFNRCGTGQALMVFPLPNMKIEGNALNAFVLIPDGGQADFVFDNNITWVEASSAPLTVLPTLQTLTPSDVLVVVSNGAAYLLPLSVLAAYLGGGGGGGGGGTEDDTLFVLFGFNS